MSRVGKQSIKFNTDVKVEILEGGDFNYKEVKVTGPKGELKQSIRRGIKVTLNDNEITLERESDSKLNKSFHGLYRTLINNLIIGVTKGFEKNLELHGVGFRVAMKGNDLDFQLGLNHNVPFAAPEGIKFEVKDQVDIRITGINKQLVGETAAKIRMLKKPEPYKGKGIRYKGEQIRRKTGKSAS